MKNTIRLSLSLLILGLSFFSCLEDRYTNQSNALTIHYDGETVQVDNPLTGLGVYVRTDGANVTVISGVDDENLRMKISGSTDQGSLRIYSKKSFSLILDGLTLINPDGPALNIQCKKHVNVELPAGVSNSLTDGMVYPADTLLNGFTEEQSAAFFSEGGLYFQGSGSLTVNARGEVQHAIASDDKIRIEGATLNVSSSQKDGIHCNDGYTQLAGTVTVSSHGDALDAGTSYVDIAGGTLNLSTDSIGSDGIVCDSTLTISGGEVLIAVSGDRSRGLRALQTIRLTGGNISITATGNVVENQIGLGVDPSYSSAVKSSSDVLIDGATLTIHHSGLAGRGISVDKSLVLSSGTVNISMTGGGAAYIDTLGTMDAYSAACISCDGSTSILGGTLIASSTGLGGKSISSDGVVTIGSSSSAPVVQLSTSNQAVYYNTERLTEPKVIKSDADVHMVNGTVLLNAAGYGEAIDTKASIFMEGGVLVAQGPASGFQVRTFDYGNEFVVTGGTLVASGAHKEQEMLPTTSVTTQNAVLLRTSTNPFSANVFIGLGDANSALLFAFLPLRNSTYLLFSSSALQLGSTYYTYRGGNYSDGTEVNGYYTGGNYSEGTRRNSYQQTSMILQPYAL
jgi:hypothetical protein